MTQKSDLVKPSPQKSSELRGNEKRVYGFLKRKKAQYLLRNLLSPTGSFFISLKETTGALGMFTCSFLRARRGLKEKGLIDYHVWGIKGMATDYWVYEERLERPPLTPETLKNLINLLGSIKALDLCSKQGYSNKEIQENLTKLKNPEG